MSCLKNLSNSLKTLKWNFKMWDINTTTSLTQNLKEHSISEALQPMKLLEECFYKKI